MNEKKNRLLDEKGRLFGKINLIDLLVVLLILAVAVVAVLKLTGRADGLPGAAQQSEIEYTVIVYRVAPEVYASVENEVALGGEHTQLMAGGQLLSGQVTAVTSQPHELAVPLEDGSMVSSPEPPYVDAIFTIRATISNPITQEVGTQEVRIGKGHIVKTKTFELTGGIVLTCAPVEAAS